MYGQKRQNSFNKEEKGGIKVEIKVKRDLTKEPLQSKEYTAILLFKKKNKTKL